MVHICKRIIPPGFPNFSFLGKLWGNRAKNDPKRQKILPVSLCISGTIPHMMVVFGTLVLNDDITSNFFHVFKILIFRVFRGGGVKEQKMTHNYQLQSVTLYMSRTVYRSYYQDILVHWCKIMTSPGVFLSLSFFLKYNIVNIKILIYIFYWLTSTVFLINSGFSSSSMNTKQKF